MSKDTIIHYFSESSYIHKKNKTFTNSIIRFFYPVNCKVDIIKEIEDGFYISKIHKNELFSNNKIEIDILIKMYITSAGGLTEPFTYLYSLKSLLNFNKYESIPISNDKKDMLKRLLNRYENLNILDEYVK